MKRDIIRVRHRLTTEQAALVRDQFVDLWPGYDIDLKFARNWRRPWRRGLGIKVVR